jgi:cytochrome c-type biogenesis protein CcmH/NrfG
MQNFCPSCGEKIEQLSNFCPNCGAKIKAEVRKEEKANIKLKISTGVVLFSGVIIALMIVFLVLQSNRTKLQEKQAATAAANNPAQSAQLNQMMQGILETKKALEEDPENFELNVKMGNNYFDIGRFKEAVRQYRNALRIKEAEPSVLIDTGVAYFNLNQMDSARYFIENALKIVPNHPQGLYNLGIVHFNVGDSLKALKYWEQLVENNENSPQANAAKQFIERIKNTKTKS